MIKLNNLQLPSALVWVDEYASQSVLQSTKRTLDGGQVVFYSSLVAGQQITLTSRQDSAWVKRSVVDSIKSMADVAGAVYSLELRGITYSVIFRHQEPPAFEAEALIPLASPTDNDYYLVTIKLMTV